ncbi:hypothetical protein M0R45_035406 [Rubus argutus]|uniref:Uncharacterized protein n=1 Tax=Rubus argutus TaxID=59490 RepID=A0AAW1VX84_RUBAR
MVVAVYGVEMLTVKAETASRSCAGAVGQARVDDDGTEARAWERRGGVEAAATRSRLWLMVVKRVSVGCAGVLVRLEWVEKDLKARVGVLGRFGWLILWIGDDEGLLWWN